MLVAAMNESSTSNITESKKQYRTVFFISDGTAITAETLGHSLLSQFPQVEFDMRILPYVDNEASAFDAVGIINQAAHDDELRPLVFDTLVDPVLRDIINTASACNLDVFEGILSKISTELGVPAEPIVGSCHGMVDSQDYKSRIDAVHFALDNDDGARTRQYDMADIILIGVSRSGKTPTCIYMALQFGIRAANYPITEDDLDDNRLPKVLKEYRHKLFGLMIDPERLVAIRNERKAGSRYASFQQCQMELRAIQGIYISEGIPSLNISEMSVEEIATRIIQTKGLKRRIG